MGEVNLSLHQLIGELRRERSPLVSRRERLPNPNGRRPSSRDRRRKCPLSRSIRRITYRFGNFVAALCLSLIRSVSGTGPSITVISRLVSINQFFISNRSSIAHEVWRSPIVRVWTTTFLTPTWETSCQRSSGLGGKTTAGSTTGRNYLKATLDNITPLIMFI